MIMVGSVLGMLFVGSIRILKDIRQITYHNDTGENWD